MLGAAALGGAILIWRWPGGWPIVAAVLLAMIAARNWDDVEKHAEPARSFGRAVLPLLLPVLVVGIAGTVAFPVWVQVPLVLVLVLVAWRAIVVPEGRQTLAALKEPISWPIRAPFGAVAVPLLLALAAFFVLIRPGDGPFEDRGGLVLLYATIPFWLAAVVLRGLGYSTSLTRLATGGALVLFVALGAALLGVIPGGDTLATHASWLSPLAALIAIPVLLGASTLGLGGPRVVPERWSGSLAALGMVSAICAAVILAGAAVDGAVSARSHTQQRVDAARDPGEPRPADSVVASPALSDRQLATLYRPVLVLAKGERWRPVAVDEFVADSTLVNRSGNRTHHPAALPDRCPGAETEACYRLQLDNQGACETADDPCAEQKPAAASEPQATSYFRVLRKGVKNGGFAFAGGDRYREPAAARAEILVQYWFFYRYNEWKRPILSGTLAQRHQGDWESVMLGLDGEAKPLFLAYSEHCGGAWRNWEEIETAPGPSRVHPLVAVALGSHANYVDTDERRSPDWASCGGGVPQGFLSLLSYASNIRDETSFGTEIVADALELIRVSDSLYPMTFPGTWGRGDRTTLENERVRILKDGASPATPSYQRLWRDPLGTVFCGEHWEPPGGDRQKNCRRPAPREP